MNLRIAIIHVKAAQTQRLITTIQTQPLIMVLAASTTGTPLNLLLGWNGMLLLQTG
jgi:hypothetical protein